MAKVSKQFELQNVVVSFVKVHEPVAKMSGEGKEYSVQVILPKDHAQTEEFKALIMSVAAEAFPGYTVPPAKRLIRDSDAEGKGAQYEYMANTYFFNLRRNENQGKVPCALPDGKLFDPTPQVLFSGCVCNIFLGVYDYDFNNTKGITASLNGIQLVDNVNVERLGGGAPIPKFGTVDSANVNAVLGDGHAPTEDEQLPAAEQESNSKPAETAIPW
jgi:hypothetical protein